MRVKILNLQSTGLGVDNEGAQRAVQVGIINVVDGKIEPKTRFDILLNPERSVQPKATELHGHTLDSLKNEKTFAQVAQDIQAALRGGDCLVVHSHYAVSLLNEEFHRLNDPKQYPHVGMMFGGHIEKVRVKGECQDKIKEAHIIDLCKLCERYFGQRGPGAYTLDHLCENYGIKQHDTRAGEFHADKRDDRVYQILVAMVKEIGQMLYLLKKQPLDRTDPNYRHNERLHRIAEKMGDKLTENGINLDDFLELEASKVLSFRLLPKAVKPRLSDKLPTDSPLAKASHPKLLRRNALTLEQSEKYARDLDKMLNKTGPK